MQRNQQQQITKQQQQYSSQQEYVQQQQQFSSQQRIEQSFTSTRQVTQQVQQRVQQHGGYVQQISQTPTSGAPAAIQYVQQPVTPTVSSTPTQNYAPPIFEQIFKNARFAQGGNATFEGRLKGTPMPEVSWTRKGAPLFDSQKYRMTYNQTTGDVTLTINQIGPGDEGEYTCRARNAVGEAICSVFIQPEGLPAPQLQQTKINVQQQQQQRVYQQQTSKQTNGYSFTSHEEEFKVDTFEYRLLREVQYREQITRRYAGELDSQLITLVDRALGPASPPLIQVKPRNSKLIEGSDAIFSMKVAGNPKVRLSWFHNGNRIIPSETKHEISYSNNQATLRIKNSTASDSGHYTLLAENTQGCVVSSAVLAIEPAQEQRAYTPAADNYAETTEQAKALAPTFIKVFQDRETQEGKMTRFDCRVTGRPYPEVTWFINQVQVNDDATHKILVNESGNHSLMITNVSRFDGGVVTCIARNKSGEVSTQGSLIVLEREQVVAPKFVERFTTVNIREGEPVRLCARAVGTPVPRITWQKDGAQLIPNDNLYIGVDGGATALDIPQAMSSDAGWYQCTAQNVAGSTATRARLFVETTKPQYTEQKKINFPKPTRVIEPEPAQEPEIIYLRHVERAKPHATAVEEDRVYPPPQFIVPLRDVNQVEGGKVHFEARIEPVGDPTMRVEFLLNGKLIVASSRANCTFQFGFVALDLISVIVEDSGEYVCRVTSAGGVAESRAILRVTQKPAIEKSTQHPSSLEYIQHLEDYSKYQRSESIEETSTHMPHFIRPLQDLGDIEEGKNAHFEAQLTPVSDPTMRVEWYKDGRAITASSRITAIFNFGYVSLNIMHLRAEDSGSYTVRAVNRIGEALSTSNIRIICKETVTGDLGISEQQRHIQKCEQLEQYHQYQNMKLVEEQPESYVRPEFKNPISDQLNIREGGFAHFEARLEPVGDSTLRVEWLKDGKVVEASSRITSFFNFGYVALTIKQVTVHDVGTYTCRAYNALGEAQTAAKMTVITKQDVIVESQHQLGLERIQQLEDSTRHTRTTVTHEKQKEQEEILLNIQPRFLGPMKGTTKIIEGQRAHFEVRVEPQSDLSMQIEWYHNGQPIMPANRIQMYHDFGYVALDILGVRGEDAGTYTVVARNSLGEAQTSATMLVETRSSIDTSTLHRGTYEKTQRMEDSKFVEPQYNIEEICRSKPHFTALLSDPQPVQEGRNIHLECKLEPVNDPTMKVEWFQNGRPITVGSRFRTYYDFGFVALDIIHASTMDVGEYTVRATNQLGSAHTSACVRVIGQRDVVTETQNEMSLEHIQFLEDGSRFRRETSEDVSIAQAPTFTRPLHNIETIEGTNVHLECRLQPVSDPYMRVDWFVNGVPVKTGHRFRPAHDFDYVALDLLGVYATDSGVYTCQARNQLGEAVTSCSVKIIAKKDLIMDSQYPAGLEKIQYLEDTSRYQRNEYVDEIVNIKPRFLTKPKSMEGMKEGQHAHFECKLEPVTDPNLKVEWFKNGRPIAIGHRFRPIHDFGYVALDITDLIAEDTATYTCRAVNLVGYDEITCNLICKGSAQILTTTQNECGLEQIQFLEDKSRYQRHEEIDEVSKQAPIFTTSLKNIEIREGQRAHFECRLIPVSDPHLKVEWYHNQIPLKSGSRFTETNNFGFVALDIMACMPEDSGTYTCRAINQLGEAITSAVAVVHSRKAIVLETQHEAALQSLRILEDTSRYHRDAVQDETITQAPVFTLPVRDVKTNEGHAVHYEARLIPVGDPKLTVQWFRNGVPIEASNRLSTMHDFGYVALNMKYANPEDSGTYTCRAINELGQAVTSATLIVQSKAALDLQTQNEAALEKIHMLEDSTRFQRREDEEVIVTQPPHFTVKLMGPSNLKEGQSAHYECRIEPYPDPNLKVEWLHNGKPIQTGHRFRTNYDFGFASLDILTVYPADSGEYTCRVTNRLGQAQSAVKLNVASRSSIIYETQNEGALEKIQYLEDASRYQRRAEEEQYTAEKPQFGRPLRNANVNEGVPIHLEATLVPVNDPTMKVEWFVNGRPIPAGSRFRTTYDFGFVALDIMDAHAEDTGTYMCKAKNAVGEAMTTCAVKVTANKILYLETLDEDRYKKIQELESYHQPKTVEAETPGQKPVFLTPLNSLENLKEGDYAHLECRVEPINDPDLRIDWFVNGKPIRAGHRFRTTHDFGYVALDILYAYGEDTGTYMCRATNKLGEAVSTCNIKVVNRRSIILDSQHPDGLEKIQKLEAQVRPSKLEVEDQPVSPPRFVTEMRGTNEAAEGQTAHFEGQIEPIHDPNLRIEFFHNGKPLQSASRFHTTFDFGYVSLDITHVVPEDAGEYTVKAFNALGQCKSSVNFKVVPKGSIIYDTQIPGGLEKIKALESAQPWQRPEIAEPATKQRPVFTQPLQNIDYLPEGQNAHFEARLIPVGDPNLKVEWFRNEKPIEDSSRIRTQHDFGFVSMDIAHIRDDDQGVYMCRATNPLGEAVTTASMKVGTKASILLETQHPEGMRKIMKLEQPLAARPEEPDRDFEKPIFTQLLSGPSEIWEGQNAHFEARVVPVGDPSLRFEWFVNGKELKLGSRIKTTTDFGFVTLDIIGSVPEDAGVYMCKAINKAGEAVSSISMKVRSKSSIVGESLLPESWEKIQLKEASMQQRPELFPESGPQQAPVFIQHLQSHDKLVEGQHIYLEATVEPKADPNLRIEWFKNGVALTTGARIKSTFDFGLVGMSINSLRDDDSAIYTCKATNLLGEAVTTCTLKVEDKHWLLGESLHPQSLPRIIDLEAPRGGKADSGEPVYESPVFITHLNNVECKENENPHFECNVEPSKDPTMKIEWFVNGKPLPAGARYKTTYDFGFCSLDIIGAYAEDSAVYTCKATNNKGTASTSGTLKCTGTATMFLDTQHPQGKAGLEAVEGKERDIADKYKRQTSVPDKDYGPPEWIVSVEPEKRLGEAQPLHLEGQVEPKQDPNLKIEWYFNGKQLQHGSRFKFTNDFGFVTLDLSEVYERDQGVYTCKAVNKKGEAFTTSTIYCTSKESLIERTQHPKGKEGLEAIQDLEDSLRKSASGPISDDEGQAPRFTSEFVPITNIVEGEIAHFEATLVPTGDQSMVIEWFHNDKQIDASHRIRTVYAFGMVILEILGTKIPDSGTYTCRATNKYGKTEQSVTLGCVDKSAGQPPKFTTQIQKLEGLKDGQSAHFECTLEPVGDPDMKVEWFHNGVPMRHSTRIKPVSDFGYVLLDIAYVQSHDSGEYICKASNKYGEDYTRATIQCYGKGGVFYDTLQPDSLARIRELESLGQQAEQPSSPTGEAPKFTKQIISLEKLVEGQSAHFEARLTPTNDPDLHVEWYWNGKKLPHGHRFRTFHDFGIVILDILYCYEENSGEYECRAVNKYGSDSTKATLKCLSKANLILDSQLPRGMEGGLEKIQTLEDSHIRDRDDRSIERGGKAPVFTVPLSNIDSLREGESAHFEARLTPTDDPKLKVEWFWNGKPLKTGSRFRTFCDFGFVILEISPVYPEDSGEYSCRATNDYGEAVTTSTMKVQGKRSIIYDSQLPKGMEGTIDKIAELEGLGAGPGQMSPDDDSGKPPEFITTPTDLVINENQLAHFECRLTPVNDPSMRVEWYHNGKALWAGSRIKTINDFGFVILEIAGCYQRDGGLYTCKATNKHGEASVSCKLQVRGRQGIVMEPQLPSSFRTGTEAIQKLEENLHKREEIPIDDETPNPPRFLIEIKDNVDIPESGPLHFDCRVEPINDPSMRIDWYHNGRPFATGSRVHMLNDFGFIALDMDYVYSRDSGVYECRATNKWGSASTIAKIIVKSKTNIILDSQLPEGMTGEKLKELERGPISQAPKDDAVFGPPKFVTLIQSLTVEESDAIRFEARVEPKEDPRLRIEWYRNGKPLPSGHRFRTLYDMGFISLDVLYVYAEDSGEYTCRAVNDFGEDFTKAFVTCKKLPSIILQNQIPKGMQKSETVMQMEATIKKYTSEIFLTEDDLFDPDRNQPPRFVVQIKSQEKLVEMQSTKFECQLAPVGDPNMRVEWFFNGKPLSFKNRFTPIYDFGYVAMNFGWVYPEDSGEYLCRATNLYGMDETRAFIKTAGKPGIIYDSQLPKGMKSLKQIREIEANLNKVPEEKVEPEKAKMKPTFVLSPDPVTIEEGEWARFCCRVTGHPRPRVMWLINGHTVVNGQRYKLSYDGMYHFDIPKTRQYDTGKIEVIARNSAGEAITSTDLEVISRKDDYRGVLKNSPRQIVGTKDYRKPEWVSQMEEMKEALSAAYALPGFVNELKNIRALEGDRVKFKCTFKGNPPPAIVWYHNNKALINGEKFRILTNDEKSTLIIRCVEREDYGFYICKAINDAGDVTTRGKLIEAFSALDEDDSRKKSEKKTKKMRRVAKSTDGKMTSSVNVEATVRSSKKSSKSSKVIGDNSVDASATFKRKIVKVPQKISRDVDESSELTITKTEEIYVQETEETFISEVEHKTCHTTITINDLKDINDLKNSKEVNEILSKLSGKNFGEEEESVKELATVSFMLQSGLSTGDIQKLFQANQFPNLQKTESQSALVQLLEREGHETIVSEIMSEKNEHEIDESFVASVGFRAFLKMIDEKKAKADELIMSIKPEDFTSWKNQASEIIEKLIFLKKVKKLHTKVQNLDGFKEENSLSITRELHEEDMMVSICSVVSDNEDTLNLVEGEKVYVMDRYNADWWFIRKQLTNEKGWTESQNLMDAVSYTHYVQKKLNEKIDKLPIIEKPGPDDKSLAPRFVEKLQPITSQEGHTVQFECKVEGFPRPQITWFRQTQIILASEDFQMYYDDDDVATLIIRDVFPEDAGTFTCVAKNAAGFASSTTELTVEYSEHGSEMTSRRSMSRESSLADILEGVPPIFSRKPKVKCVDEGSNVIIDCRLVAVPKPTIKWYFEGKELETAHNIKLVTKSDHHMYCTVMQITNVTKKQEGKYRCIATNKQGETILPIKLKVRTGEKEKPEILEPLNNTVVREGETVTFTTQIIGTPTPKVQWFKNGEELKDYVTHDKDVYTMKIITTKETDSGEYTIKATNSAGTAFAECTLTVEESGLHFEPPMFTTRFEEVVVKQNETITLSAKVTGMPQPEITWLRNNKPLQPSDRIKSEYDGENITLTITKADSETDSGDYKCVASNIIGKASHGAKVLIDVDKVKFTKPLHKTYTVEENRTTTLECETSHSVTTKWYHNDKELTGMDHRVIVHEARIHKLVIKSSSFEDAGFYKCTVKDQVTDCELKVVETKPEFIRKLEDIESDELETIVLEVEITSETATVSWYKDGEEIKPKPNKTEMVKKGKVHQLVVREVTVYDEGEYTCVLADHECSGDVTVIELPPALLYDLEDITISQGEKAIFEVELTKGDALVKWFKNGEEILFSDHVQLRIDGKKQKLKIYDALLEDGGEYSCMVGDQVSTATLKVEKPLVEFVKRLPDITLVTKDKEITMTVELTQPVNVEWFKNNEPIKPSDKYTIIDEGTVKKLIIRNAEETDAQQYTVVAENVKSTTKLKVEIIKSAPVIALDDLNKVYRVKEDDEVTFNIKFNATPKPECEWTTSETIIKKSPRHEPKVTDQYASLTIKRIVETDAGDYNVKLTNVCGEVETTLKVIYMKQPSQPGSPEPVELTDDSITLFWPAPEDDGNCEITEYILEYQEIREKTWKKITKIKETTYTITELRKDTEMRFQVTAVNEIGPSKPSVPSSAKISKPIKKEPPTFTESLKDVTIGLNKSHTLSCVVGGIPIPEVMWYKDDQPFASKFLSYESRISKYTIETTTETTAGTYKCIATNEMGESTTTCNVVIQEKPSITIDEKLISQNLRVQSQYEVVANVTGYPVPKVQWFKDNIKIDTNEEYTVETTKTTTRLFIKSIERHHSGKFTVKAKNTAGTAVVDLSVSVIDKPSKPEGPLLFREISDEAVVLEWKAPGDDGGLDIQQYSIEKCDPNQKAWIKIADVDKNIESYCIQNLTENAQYLFRVIAKNPMGSSEPLESEAVTVKRVAERPSPPRGPIEISGMTDTSFTLTWKPSEKDGGSRIIEYLVEIRESNKKVWKMLSITSFDTTTVYVQKLIKDQGYHFRITARNKIGTSDPLITDDKIVAGRQITPPSPPQNLRIVNVTSKSVTIEWETPESNGGAEITAYIIEKLLTKSSQWSRVATLDSYCLSYCIDNLKETNELNFRVSAENAMGVSAPAYTDSVILKTHATVPSPPTGPLEIRLIGSSTHVVEWGIPETDGGAPLQGYNIAIRDIKKTMWIEVGRCKEDVQKFNIRDLQDGHKYLIRIYAHNEVGLSDPLESEEPYECLHGAENDAHDDLRSQITEPTGWSTENTSSWMRDHNMDADISSYARAKLLRRDEYFFKIWHYAKKLFK